MGELTSGGRKRLKDSDFALPGRRYPIHDKAHAKNALARVAQHGSAGEKKKVRGKVYARYPGLKMNSEIRKRAGRGSG